MKKTAGNAYRQLLVKSSDMLAFSLTLALLPQQAPSVLDTVRADARRLEPWVETTVASQFLMATHQLTPPGERTLWRNKDRTEWYSAGSRAKLSAEKQAELEEVKVPESFYFNTRYGSPLAYVRSLDVAGKHGLKDLTRKKVLDFGYGSIGQLQLMAHLGATAVGVEVDPMLRELYSGDMGKVGSGSVTLLHGQWPADPNVARKAAGGYDLITSKNTLKNGYIHPEQPVDKSMLVDLGVSDEAFVKALHDALKPGGLVVIYNLSPAPSKPGEPYKPWADGRCPFSKALWEKSGFGVLAFDTDDRSFAKKMAVALGWDKTTPPMDVENDLFALYTIVKKK